MKRYSDQFISDLAQLIRHGPEPFDRLVDDLSDPDRRQRLLEALGHLSRIASESTPQPISRSRSARPFTYDDIKTPQVSGTDSELLEYIREKLTTAPGLKSRRVLLDLAYVLDVPVAKRDSMPKMIQKILESLATRNTDTIEMALNRINEADRGSTESFMELASFITGGNRNN